MQHSSDKARMQNVILQGQMSGHIVESLTLRATGVHSKCGWEEQWFDLTQGWLHINSQVFFFFFITAQKRDGVKAAISAGTYLVLSHPQSALNIAGGKGKTIDTENTWHLYRAQGHMIPQKSTWKT